VATTSYETTYYIPSSLKSVTVTGNNILYGAFRNCSSLTSVTLGDRVTSIGEDAFYRCTSLTSVTIPNSVTSIGDRAFSGCSSLTSVTIPDSVESIGSFAFYECINIKSLIIPKSVKNIGNHAFSCDDCQWSNEHPIYDVYYTGSAEDWAKINIGNYNAHIVINKIHYNYVPEE